MRPVLLTALLALPLLTAGSAKAQTSYPMLMSLKPVAAQIGTTTEHELESRYSMFGAYDVLVTGEGVTGTVVTPMEPGKDGKEPSLTKIKLSFTVAEDARPGVRDFRIVGPTGASTLGQLVITPDPVVVEQPKNDTPDLAQAIELPATVCGVIEKGEDVDYYRFTVADPTTLNFHCRGMRLEDRIHDLQQHVDPILTVKNATTGSTVAAADNTYAADPFLSHDFAPGEYLLEVRDVRYAGNRYWTYAIEISSRPFVSHVHPFGVAKGTTIELQTVAAPAAGLVSFTPPMDEPAGVRAVRLPMGEGLTNPVPVVVSELPVVIESGGENGTLETAQEVAFPAGISGRIESAADIDCFAFEAKKGDRISVEVVARRHWSGLDSIVRILNADGKPLQENDDLRLWGKRTYQDSMIENWTVPADGRYIVELRDVHLRGGDEFVYYLKLQQSEPYFELSLDTDKTWLSPGTSAVIFARAVRKNGFTGEIQLHIDGLPEGVTASCGRILAGKGNDGCIVLTAAKDAAMTASNIRVRGTADHKVDDETTITLETVAQPMQETYMPGGGRNHWPVEMHTVAIGRPADVLDVKLSTSELTLKPGESTTIDVEITRAEGFDKNVTLDMLFQHLSSKYAITLPEGVTIDLKKSKTLLTAKESKGAITLTAAANAPAVERQQCSVMANVSINFVMKATYSSPPLFVSVKGE